MYGVQYGGEVTASSKEPATERKDCFYIINLFPSDGRRFKFGYSANFEHYMRQTVKSIVPDCIIVREYKCHPDNEDFVLQRVRTVPGVVPQSNNVFDIHSPLSVIKRIDELFKGRTMHVKQDE